MPVNEEDQMKMKGGDCRNGKWYCACNKNKRLAKLRPSGKGNENQGRYYYSCFMPHNMNRPRCKFFMWQDDADELAADLQEEDGEEEELDDEQNEEIEEQNKQPRTRTQRARTRAAQKEEEIESPEQDDDELPASRNTRKGAKAGKASNKKGKKPVEPLVISDDEWEVLDAADMSDASAYTPPEKSIAKKTTRNKTTCPPKKRVQAKVPTPTTKATPSKKATTTTKTSTSKKGSSTKSPTSEPLEPPSQKKSAFSTGGFPRKRARLDDSDVEGPSTPSPASPRKKQSAAIPNLQMPPTPMSSFAKSPPAASSSPPEVSVLTSWIFATLALADIELESWDKEDIARSIRHYEADERFKLATAQAEARAKQARVAELMHQTNRLKADIEVKNTVLKHRKWEYSPSESDAETMAGFEI